MNRAAVMLLQCLLLPASLFFAHVAAADVDVTGPDGRRITLYDNGTWRYADTKDNVASNRTADTEAKALLTLERKTATGNNCKYDVRLANDYPYEIRSLVLFYSAYRANGVVYDTASSGSGFTLLKPGDKQDRDFVFRGLSCDDIVRVQVLGGDHCEMGDLDKYTSLKGQCLDRIRVVESNLVRFDK